jgi:hypothetical protein
MQLDRLLNTKDDNSTRDATKGVEVGGTIDHISIGNIIEGAKVGTQGT